MFTNKCNIQFKISLYILQSMLKQHKMYILLIKLSTRPTLLRPVISAVPLCPQTNFIVPLCPHADTTERLVRSLLSIVPLCPKIISIVFFVSACQHNGKTAVSRYVHVGVEPFPSTIFYYIHIYRNYFQLTLCELKIIKYIRIQ